MPVTRFSSSVACESRKENDTMPGQIIARGERTWLVRIYTGRDPQTGKRKYDNKTVHATKKEAQAYLNSKLTERDLGTYTSPKSILMGVLLDDLLADYRINGKSITWAKGVVEVHLRPFFGGMKAAAISTDAINRYIEKRHEGRSVVHKDGGKRVYGPASNATLNREFTLLRRAFNLGKQATPPKVTVTPRIPFLKENAPRAGFFEDTAFLAVRRALPEEIRPVISFAYFTGCRKGEILALRWSQVDLAERLVRLNPGETKNDQGRVIPLVPELYEVLKLQREIRDQYWPESDWVFSRFGAQILYFNDAWANACKAAGLITAEGKAEKRFHDLRRTGVRNLLRAGVPERVAMSISGHKTRSVFDRYNIVSENDLKEAARKLGAYVEGKRTQGPIPDERHTLGTQTPPTTVN
jgi:integrase